MSRTPRVLLLSPLLSALVCTSALAGPWTLTQSDFKQVGADVASVSATEVDATVPGGNGNTAFKVALRELVSLTRDVKIEPPSGLVLCTTSGGRIVGQSRGLDGQRLRWVASNVGEIAVPIEQVLGVLRNASEDDALLAARDEDEIRLQNGDVVRGLITAIDEKTFTITPAAGDAVALSADVIARVLVAAPAQGRPVASPPAFTLRLTNGAVLPCETVTLKGQTFRVAPLGGEPRDVPAAVVAAVEHTGGRVQWLSGRTPVAAVNTPFFGGTYAHRIGRSVVGGPIRFAGRTFDRGIGVHSYSKLTYAVEPGDSTFRTQYATDDALPYADIDVRVWVDDKVVHEQKAFHAGTLSKVIEADLRGAKTLSLEVDFGAGYDVQDRLNWIEPAILRDQR